jgi:uncharacterized protein YktA (UPF0223 family)
MMPKIRMNNEEVKQKISEVGLRETAEYMVKEAGYSYCRTYEILRHLSFSTEELNSVGIHVCFIGKSSDVKPTENVIKKSNKRPIDVYKILALMDAKWNDKKIAEEFYGNDEVEVHKTIKQVRQYHKKQQRMKKYLIK